MAGIQMNQKELTKIFMMISNWKNPFGCDVFYKLIQRSNLYNSGIDFSRQNYRRQNNLIRRSVNGN